MADQPVGQFSQPARRGGKGLRLAAALPGPRPGDPHAGHHRRFVHVEARTPRVHDVHGAAFPEGAGRLWVKNFLMRDHSARAVSTRWGTSKRPGSGSAPGFVGTINVTDLWTLHARSIRSFSGTGSGDSHMMGSAETSQRLACDASRVVMRHTADGRAVEVGARTRTIPPALRRVLHHRDRGCRFPGCGLPFGQGHHIRHWAHGGPTTLSNLALLCRRHHRAVHEEGYQMDRQADGERRGSAFTRGQRSLVGWASAWTWAGPSTS